MFSCCRWGTALACPSLLFEVRILTQSRNRDKYRDPTRNRARGSLYLAGIRCIDPQEHAMFRGIYFGQRDFTSRHLSEINKRHIDRLRLWHYRAYILSGRLTIATSVIFWSCGILHNSFKCPRWKSSVGSDSLKILCYIDAHIPRIRLYASFRVSLSISLRFTVGVYVSWLFFFDDCAFPLPNSTWHRWRHQLH